MREPVKVKLPSRPRPTKSFYCWLNAAKAPYPPEPGYAEARAILIHCKSEAQAKYLYRWAPMLKHWLIPEEMKYFEAIPVRFNPKTHDYETAEGVPKRAYYTIFEEDNDETLQAPGRR
jgi:hypothetical protein